MERRAQRSQWFTRFYAGIVETISNALIKSFFSQFVSPFYSAYFFATKAMLCSLFTTANI